jgi:hypothetical protein
VTDDQLGGLSLRLGRDPSGLNGQRWSLAARPRSVPALGRPRATGGGHPQRGRACGCTAPHADGLGGHRLRWGDQLDIWPITAFEAGTAITEEAAAAYIAKYATKGAEASGTVDRPIKSADEISLLPLTEHAQAMIITCWALGGLAKFAHLNLRKWAHMLGFRGHFTVLARFS